jgi:hypothetical protein
MMKPARGLRSRPWWPSLVEAAKVAWLPWLVARVIVDAALGMARYENSHLDIRSAKAALAAHEGLLSWDASWYRSIAELGYGGTARSGLRFFPLFPLMARVLHLALHLPAGLFLVLLANAASFVAVVGIYLLARRELDPTSARRAAWLLCLSPASFVLVMGYAEALLIALVIVVLFCVRTERWWLAAAAGLLAGATRPLGLLVAIFVLAEALRRWGGSETRARLGAAAAVLAPLLGATAYLSWVAARYGDFLLPYRVQTSSTRHGGLGDPLVVLWHAAGDLSHGHVGTALHVPWIALCALLVVACFFRLPASYGLFAAAVIIAALSGHNLDSFERYALSAVPLVIVAGSLMRSDRVAATVLCLTSVVMFAYALLAFLGSYIP